MKIHLNCQLEKLRAFISEEEIPKPSERSIRDDMDTVKSVRLPEDLLRSVRYLARRERLDESNVIRKLIALGTAEYAVRLYREGKITLREAAELASVTPREMIEILLDHGVKGNVTVSQARKSLEYVLAAQGSRTRQSIRDAKLTNRLNPTDMFASLMRKFK
jgi:hypothetical protein